MEENNKTRKIHCIDAKENSTLEELREMVGFIEPNNKGKVWDVTLIEGYFECKTQESAEIMASTEETKALLMRLLKNGRK